MKNKHPDRHLPKKRQSKATESGRKTKQKRPEKKEKGQYTPPSKSEQSRRSVYPHTPRGEGKEEATPPRCEPRMQTKRPNLQGKHSRGEKQTRDRCKQQNAVKATSKHHKNQIPREKRRANQRAREKRQVKRYLGARTTAPKKSQQPGYPPPRGGPPKGLTIHVQGSGPLKGFTNHRKLRELAETLVHPRLKTERGNSPSPTTHSCRKEKLRAKNQGPKAKVQEEPGLPLPKKKAKEKKVKETEKVKEVKIIKEFKKYISQVISKRIIIIFYHFIQIS